MSEFQKIIKKKYKSFTVDKDTGNYDKLCGKTEIKLNKVQQFLGEYVKKENRLLLYHGIGSGKTITIIHMCESCGLHGKMYIITQASLIESFYDEILKYDIMTKNHKYITAQELQIIQRYEDVRQEGRKADWFLKKQYTIYLKDIKKRLNKKYRVMSYEIFCKFNRYDISDEQLLIIDEVQNIIGENNTRYYKILRDLEKSEPHYGKCGIILSSGTPIYDNYKDFFMTVNLLTPDKPFNFKKLEDPTVSMDEKKEFIKSLVKFINRHVSYYEPSKSKSIVYPKREISTIECPMSEYQTKQYEKTGVDSKLSETVESLPLNFFLGPRMVSNFAFPKIKVKGKGIKPIDIKVGNIYKYSSKYYALLKKFILNPKYKKEKMIIYSSFVNEYGIKLLKNILTYNGFYDYKKVYKNGEKINPNVEKYKTFACFSGKETEKYKNEIKNFFNNEKNNDGINLRIILISPAGKEGLSLFGVRQIHIMEPYWNMSRIYQIMGRGFRRCSHRFLPPKDRDLKVFIYIATKNNNKKQKEDTKKIKKIDYIKKYTTIDQYIFDIARKKEKMNEQFNDLLRKNSIDCELFKNANGIKQCKSLNLEVKNIEKRRKKK